MDAQKINVFWFRRDLRLEDNRGLYHALKQELPVLPIFIFDEHFFQQFGENDKRFSLIYDQILQLHQKLQHYQSSLLVLRGKPIDIFEKITEEYTVEAVYCNEDYEPYSLERDKQVANWLKNKGIHWHSYPDHVIFTPQRILKENQTPYTIFTPYKRKWLSELRHEDYQEYPSIKHVHHLLKLTLDNFPNPKTLGIHRQPYLLKPIQPNNIKDYEQYRDFPALQKTSFASVHLRFGLVSKRALVRLTLEQKSDTYLNELIWHEFFTQILYHFPFVVTENFNPRYNHLQWLNNEADFEKWCKGQTGYSLVDAGIRELITTGYMHNRVRMIVASFLCKHLLIDWRWGELFFAQHLMDYDLAVNNGNWQWCAGTGCDAAPFFRIFNPLSQQKKYDPENKYIIQWLPEGTPTIPMIEHQFARQRALKWFKESLP